MIVRSILLRLLFFSIPLRLLLSARGGEDNVTRGWMNGRTGLRAAGGRRFFEIDRPRLSRGTLYPRTYTGRSHLHVDPTLSESRAPSFIFSSTADLLQLISNTIFKAQVICKFRKTFAELLYKFYRARGNTMIRKKEKRRSDKNTFRRG